MNESGTEDNGAEINGENGDRRQDIDSRTRIVLLEQRYQWITRKLFYAMLWLAFGTLSGFGAGAYLYNQLQSNRVVSIERVCEGRNDDRLKLRQYIIRQSEQTTKSPLYPQLPQSVKTFVEKENGKTIERLPEDFPIEPDCHAYAVHLLDAQ